MTNPQGPWAEAIAMMQRPGSDYPQIRPLFAYAPNANQRLARLTQVVLREPGPLTPGFRELISAYTSSRNHWAF